MTTNQHPLGSPDDDRPDDELTECAHQAETAIRRLAHLSLNRPSLTPAEVDVVLGYLAETVAALPQIAGQFSGILDRSRHTHVLVMDGMTATTDPDLAVDTARLHLDQLGGPAIKAYRHLDAARNEAAHISATPRTDDFDSAPPPENRVRRRPEDRQPPQAPGPIGRGPTH